MHRHRARVSAAGLLVVVMLLAGCGGVSSGPEAVHEATPSDPGATATSISDSDASGKITPAPGAGSETPATNAGGAPISTVPTSVASWVSSPAEIAQVFSGLAAEVGSSMTLYEPTEIPAGIRLATRWWPLDSGAAPDTRDEADNPHVTGGSQREVRVLFQVGDGWLEVIQGVRGDLGDLPGEPVGSVDGRPAVSYRVLGGDLVQWNVDGVWYAVYGKGIAQDDVTRFARGMRVCLP
ncbi:MAG: hypothetical protein M5U22_03570 [Thermoleophilia bacterium]|nr:hypothetical protein [Thermoleophilia bacterium]